jgi:hypothetical protein
MCLQGRQARAARDAARRGEVVHFAAAAARPRRPLGRALRSSTALSGAAGALAGACFPVGEALGKIGDE